MEMKEADILEFMNTGAHRPLSLKELMKALDIPQEQKRTFRKFLKDMVLRGELVRIRGGRYGLPSRMNLVTGELACHPDGFGFVTPDEGGADIFIPPRRLNGAMHGDRVVVRIEARRRGGEKREGSIIRVLSRAHKRIVGRFVRLKGVRFVIPSNERILERIMIPPGKSGRAKDGEIVEAEITKWPTSWQAPLGRVAEILGDSTDPDVEIDIIARKYDLPRRFPRQVVKEAKKIPPELLPEDLAGRVDLRQLNICTIDGEKARDFDDAVAIEKKDGHYILYVSIADVSHYVKEGSPLDKEASLRGTSVYFPDRCIPMLPENLSNGICSLNPGEDRLALTVETRFSRRGVPVDVKFYESVIRSRHRLTYTEVSEMLENKNTSLIRKYSSIYQELRLMEELARKLNRERIKLGSIDFDLPEPEIIIDMEGRPQDIVKAPRTIAHRIVEEFMLTANRKVAELFEKGNYPTLYRVHEAPAPEKLEALREFLSGFGYTLDRKVTPRTFQKLLDSVKGRPEEQLVNHVMLRAMKQAIYSDENIGHFGLAFPTYTHFTSPIRRYPDLVVHRLLKKLLHKRYTTREQHRMAKLLPQIADNSSRCERRAMEAERECVDLKKAQFMQDKIGEVFEGLISGVESFGFFVELKEYFVEGLVHITTLRDDFYLFDEKRHALIGENTRKRYYIGKEVLVRIRDVDIERRRIELEPAERRGRKKKNKPVV